MAEIDPLSLSRRLATLTARVVLARRELGRGTLGVDPFSAHDWPGQSTFDEVSSWDKSDPLRGPSLRWVAWLVDERIQQRGALYEGHVLHQELHGIRTPRDGEFSLAQLSELSLTTHGPERRGFLKERARLEAQLGTVRLELWARRAEVARRLGLTHVDELLGPLGAGPRVAELAEQFLGQTDGVWSVLPADDYAAVFEGLLAESAHHGLPARLAPDSLLGLLGGPSWMRGLKLPAFTLPRRLAPSSFLLAFERLGKAWAEALAPREYPFVVARDPLALAARRHGALLASWWVRPSFLRRRLGLNGAQAESQGRALVLAFVLEGRRRAAAVLLREAALSGQLELGRLAPALSVRLWGEELAPLQLLGRRSLGPTAAAEFVAFLAAFARDQELSEAHDEDYFDNPRAQERLRDEAGIPAAHTLPAVDVVRGGEHLSALLSAAF